MSNFLSFKKCNVSWRSFLMQYQRKTPFIGVFHSFSIINSLHSSQPNEDIFRYILQQTIEFHWSLENFGPQKRTTVMFFHGRLIVFCSLHSRVLLEVRSLQYVICIRLLSLKDQDRPVQRSNRQISFEKGTLDYL